LQRATGEQECIAYYELNVLLRLKYVLTDSHILRDQRIAIYFMKTSVIYFDT
jgi:hypothetical protein